MSTDEFRLKFKIESNGHEFEEAKKKRCPKQAHVPTMGLSPVCKRVYYITAV